MGFVAQLKNVDFGYGDRLILENISLEIPKGKVVSVMGGSGSGKTTLLRMVAGLETVDRGVIRFGDKVVNRWTGTATHTGNFFGIPPTGKSVTAESYWRCVTCAISSSIVCTAASATS